TAVIDAPPTTAYALTHPTQNGTPMPIAADAQAPQQAAAMIPPTTPLTPSTAARQAPVDWVCAFSPCGMSCSVLSISCCNSASVMYDKPVSWSLVSSPSM